MAAPRAWSPFQTAASTTSYCIDFGAGNDCNAFWIKNTDASIRIWFKLGDSAMPNPVAAATTVGANASVPLAAGESYYEDGLNISKVAVISDSGAPIVKGLGLGKSLGYGR